MAGTNKPTRYWANRPMGYGPPGTPGKSHDRGQIVTLTGNVHDTKLIEFRYVLPVDDKAETFRCVECGAEFVDMASRTAHGDKRHAPQRELTPEQADRAFEREEARLQAIAPIGPTERAVIRT